VAESRDERAIMSNLDYTTAITVDQTAIDMAAAMGIEEKSSTPSGLFIESVSY
jgi:hypothetical protein